jgi:hypothetical protein
MVFAGCLTAPLHDLAVSSHFLIFVVSLSLVYQVIRSEQLIRTNKHGLQQLVNKSNRLKLFREQILTHPSFASSETSRSESIHQGVGQSHIATTHNTLSRQRRSAKHSSPSFFACTPCISFPSTNSSLTSTPSKKNTHPRSSSRPVHAFFLTDTPSFPSLLSFFPCCIHIQAASSTSDECVRTAAASRR